jgi:hypothetical protein
VAAHIETIDKNLAISDITEAAQDGNVSLTQLVREGKTHEARMRADLDTNLAKLAALKLLRDSGIWQVANPVSAAGVDLNSSRNSVLRCVVNMKGALPQR